MTARVPENFCSKPHSQYVPLNMHKISFLFDLYDIFSHILQGCFTGTGQSYDCPSTSEATLKDMGKMDNYWNTAKRNKAWTMCII